MDLGLLQVIHRHKATALAAGMASPGPLPSPAPSDSFFLDSCQRQIWITWSRTPTLIHGAGIETFSGEDAYRFLLRVATGLESQVRGETEIFGQLKLAWKSFEDTRSPLLQKIGPWMQKLFEDTKEIRSRHLQNMGGASYGSLVRKLLREYEVLPGEPILLVGAGHLARKVAPWLKENEIWVWNRSQSSLQTMLNELAAKDVRNIRVISGELAEARAWRLASHAVICIPTDEQGDARRIRWWKEGKGERRRSLVHLGDVKARCGAWSTLPGFHALDDIFALQRAYDETRIAQFACAARACDEKALLRSLAGSPSIPISLPHGWEDLAIFA